MRTVELLGIPGSGKTTLARALAATGGALTLDEAVRASLRRGSDDILTRAAATVTRTASSRTWKRAYQRSTDRATALSGILAANPGVLETFLRVQRVRRERDLAPEMALGWMLGFLADFQIATRPPDVSPVLVVDEGFRQRSVSLVGAGFADPPDVELLGEYLDSCPGVDVLVVMNTPLGECMRRLDARGWSKRVDGQGPEERLAFLEGCSRVVAAVVAHQSAAGARIVDVEETTPADGPTLADLIAPQST